jgi:hypothetical protein
MEPELPEGFLQRREPCAYWWWCVKKAIGTTWKPALLKVAGALVPALVLGYGALAWRGEVAAIGGFCLGFLAFLAFMVLLEPPEIHEAIRSKLAKINDEEAHKVRELKGYLNRVKEWQKRLVMDDDRYWIKAGQAISDCVKCGLFSEHEYVDLRGELKVAGQLLDRFNPKEAVAVFSEFCVWWAENVDKTTLEAGLPKLRYGLESLESALYDRIAQVERRIGPCGDVPTLESLV